MIVTTPKPLLEAAMRWSVRARLTPDPISKLALIYLVSEQVQHQRPVPHATLTEMCLCDAGERTVQRGLHTLQTVQGVGRIGDEWSITIPWEDLLLGHWRAPAPPHDGTVVLPDLTADELARLAEIIDATRYEDDTQADARPQRPQPPVKTPIPRVVVVSKAHAKVHQIADRDGWTCYLCGVQLIDVCRDDDVLYDAAGGRYVPPDQAHRLPHRDHRIPKSMGGSDQLVNLALACTPCNLKKGAE